MSQGYTITKVDEFNPVSENLEFKKPIQNPQGGRVIPFNYMGARLYLKTPKMRSPFGVQENSLKPGTYQCELSFDTDNEKAQVFQEKLKTFDSSMISAGMENAFDWGLVKSKSKTPTRDSIEDKYNSMLRYSKYPRTHAKAGEVNPEWPPSLRFKLPKTKERPANPETGEPAKPSEFRCDIYNVQKELLPVSPETIPKNSRVTVLLSGFAWQSTTGFGVSWSAEQIMVFPRTGLPNQCLIDDPEDFEDMDGDSQDNFLTAGNAELDNLLNEETQEEEAVEDDGEEFEEEASTPAPSTAKKVSVTKKT